MVSVNQQLAVFITGVLWTRYSFVINPINWNLAIANFFMGTSAAYQLYRKLQVPEEKGGFWGPAPKKQ